MQRDHITESLICEIIADQRSTAEIANSAGIPRSTIAMAMSGHTQSFSLDTAIRLAWFYGYDVRLRRRSPDD